MPHPDALARLDQSPREALAMARETYNLAFAKNDSLTLANTALTLAIILNRLGEFRDALSLGDVAATQFFANGDDEHAAHALCEVAWAHTFIGDLSQSSAAMERARVITSSSLIHARCTLIEARVLSGQAHYPEAIKLLEKACNGFQAVQLPLDAARCERELVEIYIWSGQGETVTSLVTLRQTFEASGCILDAAICDLMLAIVLSETNRYFQTLEPLLSARDQLTKLQAHFFVAWCDLVLGIVYRHLNRFDESLQRFHQARDYYLSHTIRKDVSACDINLGNTYYVLNRYDEALALYQEAADLSLADGREARAARIYTNMGLVYAKQGNFSKALDLHYRALQIATSKDLAVLAASNHGDLAACCRQLGQYDKALVHLQERARLAGQVSGERFAAHRIDLAALYSARGETAKAIACLQEAKIAAVAEGLDSFVAVCDRQLAHASVQTKNRKHTRALVQNARRLFLKHTQTVDAALCDLTEGELHLAWKEFAAAQACFQRARDVLSPAFPDQAWRTDYGLGRCASATGDPAAALAHYLRAVRAIATSRSLFVTEQLSNDFFAHRQSVFDEALSVALQQGAAESALEVIEASKARTFLTALQGAQRDWKLRDDHGDPHIAGLIAREKELRYQLDALAQRVAVQAVQGNGEPLRGNTVLTPSSAELQELNALSQVYESVVTQLRLAIAGLAGVSAPAPFALEKFREAAHAAFGPDWTALDYYLTGDTLMVVIVDSECVRVERKMLSAYDCTILDDCVTTEPDLCELVYRGTLNGMAAPTPGTKYLQYLYRLLIPSELGATLIISPHGKLHALPFHALIAPRDGAFLIEQHTVLYSPNLQALQLLLNEPVDSVVRQPLVVGVSDFGDRMRPLPSAAIEVDAVNQAWEGRGESLRGEQATRRKLLELNATGKLRNFDVLHLATHAVLDSAAPYQSCIALADDNLTVTDILDLSLNARLVTLSACQTALGNIGRGDELIGLARAFFYAGARALLATLWQVEDTAMVELTGKFYRNLAQGKNAALALREAQIAMIRAGCPAYHWAPFVLIGRP